MILELEGVSKSYTKDGSVLSVLQGVSLSLESGDFVSVRGPSGCGKTTLLLVAGGLLKPQRGSVTLGNMDMNALSPGDRASGVGFVFQEYYLIAYLTVFENILAASLAVEVESPETRGREMLVRFGLESRALHYPSELSTGERQRVALARAMMVDPDVILADEPTGNLDSDNAKIVLDSLATFADDGGAVLLVTHDDRAARYARTTLILKDGKLAKTY